LPSVAESEVQTNSAKRQLENGDEEEDVDAKRRRILEETRDIDADSENDEEDDSSDDDRWASHLLCSRVGRERGREIWTGLG
jgi:protein CWC15